MENEKKITEIVENFSAKLFADGNFFFAPSIPEKKLQNASNSYMKLVDDIGKTLLLYDDTALGSATEGFIISEKYLVGREFLGNPISLKLKNIESVTIKKGIVSSKIVVNSQVFFQCYQAKSNSVLLLGDLLQEIQEVF